MTKGKTNHQHTQQEDVKQQNNTSQDNVGADAATESDANVADESFENNDNSAHLAELESEWKDKYMRLSAEFDNYRKRTLKEKMDLIASGGEDVIKSILTVVDDMDRAAIAMETSTDMNAVKEGILLIAQKLNDTLKGKGVAEIVALGEILDTDLHEAIAKIPAPSEEHKGKIIDVVQKGYKLKDKIIRHSKVVVGE